MNQLPPIQDLIIVVLSLIFFPMFVGALGFIAAALTDKNDIKKCYEEARRITYVMWAVVALGMLVAILI